MVEYGLNGSMVYLCMPPKGFGVINPIPASPYIDNYCQVT